MTNLTGRAPYQKGDAGNTRARKPNAEELKHWARVLQLPCAVTYLEPMPSPCKGRMGLHHAETGQGKRKDHMKVLHMCWNHHQGPDGIDGREYGMSKRRWQEIHTTERELLDKQAAMMAHIK